MDERQNRKDLDEGIDSQQFLRLLLANQGRIYAYILTMVPNWSDADDIFQETSIVLWKKMAQFRPGSNFVAWAMSVTHYEILAYKRKKGCRSIQFDHDMLEILECESSVIVKQDQQDCLTILQHCMKHLNVDDQRLVMRKYQGECQVDDLAREQGISVRGIYKRLARIHDVLIRCVRRKISLNEDGKFQS